jgi:serine O-acetyltransferase
MRELTLRAGSLDRLALYVAHQLGTLFPDDSPKSDLDAIHLVLATALERLRPMLAAVRAFETDRFDHFHTLQYTALLYLLGNEAWLTAAHPTLPDRLFGLNRALNGIDIFYAVTMPEIFFVSHGLGSVLGNVTYGNRLTVFQNVTVGRVGDARPLIGDDVVLYPGSTVTGRTKMGRGSVASAGVMLHNIDVPEGMIATADPGGGIAFHPARQPLSALYFNE